MVWGQEIPDKTCFPVALVRGAGGLRLGAGPRALNFFTQVIPESLATGPVTEREEFRGLLTAKPHAPLQVPGWDAQVILFRPKPPSLAHLAGMTVLMSPQQATEPSTLTQVCACVLFPRVD